jgi:hypothetical protein
MLVIEGYLWEDMVVTRDQMATAYLRLGAKAQLLLQVWIISSSCNSVFWIRRTRIHYCFVWIRIRILSSTSKKRRETLISTIL